MNNLDFDRYIDDIKQIPEDRLKDYSTTYEKKVIRLNKKTKQAFKQIVLTIIAYFLLKNSVIDGVKIGPFNISDLNLIFCFVPVAVSYLISIAATSFYSAFYHNFILSLILRRYYKLEERTILFTRSLPINSEHPAIRKQEPRGFSLNSCLIQLPLAITTLSLGVLVIPLLYYFVISTIIESYNISHELSVVTFWIPNIFALYFLLLAIQYGYYLLELILNKSDLYDSEDLISKRKKKGK